MILLIIGLLLKPTKEQANNSSLIVPRVCLKVNLMFEILAYLKSNLNYKLVFTKSDKLTQANKAKFLETFNIIQQDSFQEILFTSTKTKEGIKELKRFILKNISENEKRTQKNI